jgi:hypothetical protein
MICHSTFRSLILTFIVASIFSIRILLSIDLFIVAFVQNVGFLKLMNDACFFEESLMIYKGLLGDFRKILFNDSLVFVLRQSVEALHSFSFSLFLVTLYFQSSSHCSNLPQSSHIDYQYVSVLAKSLLAD